MPTPEPAGAAEVLPERPDDESAPYRLPPGAPRLQRTTTWIETELRRLADEPPDVLTAKPRSYGTGYEFTLHAFPRVLTGRAAAPTPLPPVHTHLVPADFTTVLGVSLLCTVIGCIAVALVAIGRAAPSTIPEVLRELTPLVRALPRRSR